MSQESVTVAARATITENVTGKFFTVISATSKLTVEINGVRREVRAGSKISAGKFKRITFIETQGYANTVVYDAGDEEFQGEIQVSGANAASYMYGNCNIANSASANLPNSAGGNTSVACTADGYLTFPNNANVLISSTNAGHRRQQIIFSIAPTTKGIYGVNVLDANQNTFMTIPAGSPPVALITDSDLYISGAGGNAYCSVGQVFLNS